MLDLFLSSSPITCVQPSKVKCARINVSQLIPSDIKWDPNATPPQYTDNGDQVIEKGTHLRIKLIGTRSDVGSMFAIGSIKEDFLGFDAHPSSRWALLTGLQDPLNSMLGICDS